MNGGWSSVTMLKHHIYLQMDVVKYYKSCLNVCNCRLWMGENPVNFVCPPHIILFFLFSPFSFLFSIFSHILFSFLFIILGQTKSGGGGRVWAGTISTFFSSKVCLKHYNVLGFLNEVTFFSVHWSISYWSIQWPQRERKYTHIYI